MAYGKRSLLVPRAIFLRFFSPVPYVFYKIVRIVRALSLVNSCVKMRVWKHGCDITRVLIGYMPSDARFGLLVGNMSVYQENLFQSRSFLHFFLSFVELSLGNIL